MFYVEWHFCALRSIMMIDQLAHCDLWPINVYIAAWLVLSCGTARALIVYLCPAAGVSGRLKVCIDFSVPAHLKLSECLITSKNDWGRTRKSPMANDRSSILAASNKRLQHSKPQKYVLGQYAFQDESYLYTRLRKFAKYYSYPNISQSCPTSKRFSAGL